MKEKQHENKIENKLHQIGEKVLSHDRVIKSEGLNELIVVASKESKYLIRIEAFQILLDQVINELIKEEGKLTYTDTGKILAFLIDLIPNATFFFNSRSEKLTAAGSINIMVTNAKLKKISSFYCQALAKHGQVNIFLPQFITQYNKATVSAVIEKAFLLE